MKTRILTAHLKSLISRPSQYVRVVLFRGTQTDIMRWSKIENLDPDWDERTRLMAAMIPDGTSVIEFGAARLTLPAFLGPNSKYRPSDLVSRSGDTLVLDLNGPLPVISDRYDYAVFSGVFEYLHDCQGVLNWISDFVDNVVLSYATFDLLEDPVTRARNGWVNHYQDKEIRKVIEASGFSIDEHRTWRMQKIFKCRRQSMPA